MSSRIRAFLLSPALLSVAALSLCLLLANPLAEIGLDDDWSYIWSARDLALTGHIHYNGWSTAMLGWQLYLGAAMLKLAPFSFTHVRIAGLLIALATTALVERLLQRLGLTPANALFATLTLVLSPLFLPLAFTFMSDIPGLLAILLCLYMCVRAVQARTPRAAQLWLVSAALVNALDGTVRQIAWLGLLVLVPSTAWYLRRQRHLLAVTAAAFAVGLAFVLASMRWFSRQPYVLNEKILAFHKSNGLLLTHGQDVLRGVLATGLFLLPVLAAFLVKLPLRNPRVRTPALVAAGILAAALLLLLTLQQPVLTQAPLVGNLLGLNGALSLPGILGPRPVLFSAPLLNLLLIAVLAAVIATWLTLRGTTPIHALSGPSQNALKHLLLPFTLASLLLLGTREAVFDRYLLPIFFVALVVLLRAWQSRFGGRLPATCFALLFLFTAFSVASLHDVSAFYRARVTAAEHLEQAGIARTAIRGGLEYDAWTQIQTSGFINDHRIRNPAGAYQEIPLSTSDPCLVYFSEHTPAIHGQYALATKPVCSYPLAPFHVISYRTWLPPFHGQVYTLVYPHGL